MGGKFGKVAICAIQREGMVHLVTGSALNQVDPLPDGKDAPETVPREARVECRECQKQRILSVPSFKSFNETFDDSERFGYPQHSARCEAGRLAPLRPFREPMGVFDEVLMIP